MHVAVLTIEIHIPESAHLKAKRSIVKPLVVRLQREYNISVSEVDRQDNHHLCVIACAMISTSIPFLEETLSRVPEFIARTFPNIQVYDTNLEILA